MLVVYFLQLFALLLIFSYYYFPYSRSLWDGIAQIKEDMELWFIILVPVFCGGIIPFICLYIPGKISPNYVISNIIFCILFWGYRGAEVNYLYEFLAYCFGDSTQALIILKKVL